MDRLVVIAIGGNSLIKDSTHRSVYDQYKAAGETSDHIATLVERGYRILITHGNGPQVGFILLRSEMAKEVLHEVPLDSCGADTQGAIGYQITQTLHNELNRRGIDKEVVAVVTQVVVEQDDPFFESFTKPIGPFYGTAAARDHQKEGWVMIEDAGRGWRRVVASPRPTEIIEQESIRALLEQGAVVVAAGGGGIPVIRKDDGSLEGVAAVVDKDLTSSLLATKLGAEILIISTAVDKVALNYGKPDQEDLDRMTVDEAKRYLGAGQFAAGSMRPKIEAAIAFLEGGGGRVIVTQPHQLEAAIEGDAGTHIVS